MSEVDANIGNVSDTSLWVAYYRAQETERADSIFKDPYAKALSGIRGQKIAESMGPMSRYVEFSVVTRTIIIDEYIESLIQDGIDMVINLGAGLDARPYRMNLPKNLKWVEVDYPHIINHKTAVLKSESPNCELVRVELDLANDVERLDFLQQMNSTAKKVLILTEGVIPYLTEQQVGKLAAELYSQKNFSYWIAEYFNPEIYKRLRSKVRTQKMKNAPFQFEPKNWFEFFKTHGWIQKEIRYNGEEGARRRRKPPMPWWASLLMPFVPAAVKQRASRVSGYVIFKRIS